MRVNISHRLTNPGACSLMSHLLSSSHLIYTAFTYPHRLAIHFSNRPVPSSPPFRSPSIELHLESKGNPGGRCLEFTPLPFEESPHQRQSRQLLHELKRQEEVRV
jgi:hypothetical protein